MSGSRINQGIAVAQAIISNLEDSRKQLDNEIKVLAEKQSKCIALDNDYRLRIFNKKQELASLKRSLAEELEVSE